MIKTMPIMKDRDKVYKVKSLLFKGCNWLGDAVMSLPTIYFARQIFPDAKISILTIENIAELYEDLNYIDEVIPYRLKTGLKKIKSMNDVIMKLKNRKFNCAIIFPRSFSSAFMIYMSKIPYRIGYKADARTPFLTHPVHRDDDVINIHRVYYFMNLLSPIYKGKKIPSKPKITISQEMKEWADRKIKECGIKHNDKIVGFNPGALYGTAKMWPIERYAEVAKKLIHSNNIKILLFGTRSEANLAQKFCDLVNNKNYVFNFAGATSLRQLCALINKCHLFITNDTGAMHIADALGVPIIAIFGSTDPYTTGPYGSKKTIIRHNVDCSPCLLRRCPTDHKCMNLIKVEEVYEAGRYWLEKV